MRNLLRRSLSGIIYVLIFVSAILFSKESYITLVAFFAIIAIYELSKITKFKSIISYILFGLALFLMLKRPNSYAIKMVLGINIISSLYLIYQLFAKKEIVYVTEREKLGLTIRYLIFSFCFLILLPLNDENYNPYLMLSILVLIWVMIVSLLLLERILDGPNYLFLYHQKRPLKDLLGALFLRSLLPTSLIIVT